MCAGLFLHLCWACLWPQWPASLEPLQLAAGITLVTLESFSLESVKYEVVFCVET